MPKRRAGAKESSPKKQYGKEDENLEDEMECEDIYEDEEEEEVVVNENEVNEEDEENVDNNLVFET